MRKKISKTLIFRKKLDILQFISKLDQTDLTSHAENHFLYSLYYLELFAAYLICLQGHDY